MSIPRNHLPDWLGAGDGLKDHTPSGGHIHSSSFHGLRAASRAFAETRQTERRAHSPGWLQRLRPEVKLLSLLALIVTASLLHDARAIAAIWIVALLLAASTRLPVGGFLKRNLVAALLFGLLPGIPALLNWLVPGTPLVVIARLAHPPLGLPETLAVTRQGLRAGLLLTTRVGTSIALTLLLVWTTPVFKLLGALPFRLSFLLSVSYRYLVVLLQEMQNLLQARVSRQLGRLPIRSEQSIAGSGIGWLFLKSQRIANDLGQAMTSRGFTGE